MSSSALTNLVPVLNSENSVLWFQQMTAYLMSTSEWDIIENYLELTVNNVFSHVVDVPAVMSPGGQHVATAATTQTRNDHCLAINDSYLRLSIGNAPWPIGVTMVGYGCDYVFCLLLT